MSDNEKYRKDKTIRWYRCKVDPAVMKELVKRSDLQGLRQALGHLGLWCHYGVAGLPRLPSDQWRQLGLVPAPPTRRIVRSRHVLPLHGGHRLP